MNKQRADLIAELTADLKPVAAGGRTAGFAMVWLIAAGSFSYVALLLTGSMRAGSLAQLLETPQFLAESLIGAAAIVALVIAGLRLSVPSMRPLWSRVAFALSVLAVWVGCYLYGLLEPALEPAMAGKRGGCWYETTLIGIPALLAGLSFSRRLWPLHGAWSGFMLGLAAGAIPALLMQFACMYIPQHILLHHLGPGLLLGPVGGVLGWLLLRPR